MKDWKKIKLKEILIPINNRNKERKINRVLSVTNSQGFIEQREYFERSIHSINTSNYKIIEKDQFAFNPSRVNVGSIDLLKNYDIGILSPMYITFAVDEEMIIPEYLNYYFQTNAFFEKVKKNTQGSVRDTLNFNDLLNFDLLLPTKNEQKIIIRVLENIDNIIVKYDEKIKKSINEKEYIQKKIFNNLNKTCEKEKLANLFERITDKNVGMKSTNILTISAQEGLVSQYEYFNKMVAGKNLENYYFIIKVDFFID